MHDSPEERRQLRETLRKYRQAVIRYEARRTREALGREQEDVGKA